MILNMVNPIIILKLFLLTFILNFASSAEVFSQSYYEIDTFTLPYDTLNDYNSIVLENLNSGKFYAVFERDVELGFKFPFFEESYEKAFLKSDGLFYFGNGFGYFHIYALINDWHTCSEPEKNDYSSRDYRYKTDKVGNRSVFIIEWHDIALCKNSWNSVSYPYNFQVWLWDDGNIEIRFGKMNTTDKNIYIEGEGFILDDFGPSKGDVGIINPQNDYCLIYSGLYDSPKIIEGHPDSVLVRGETNLKSLPHEGFVIRFKKMTSSVDGPSDDWFDLPTLVSASFSFPQEFKIEQVSIYDLMGRKVLTSNQHEIDISGIQNGMYIMTWSDGKMMRSHKFYKK
jgi:hypothetical protein